MNNNKLGFSVILKGVERKKVLPKPANSLTLSFFAGPAPDKVAANL